MSRWRNIDATQTGFDDYENELSLVVNTRKFITRAEVKPMAKIRDKHEAHIISRARHMQQAANVIKRLAKGLGLNEVIPYIGMLMHDAGHTYGGHDGERAMDIIMETEYIGHYHHNAEGVDVALNEDIPTKLIDAVPNSAQDEELRDKLSDEVWLFLDIVNGHDGEATPSETKAIRNKRVKYNSIKEAVLTKVSKSRRYNKFKGQVETLEAELARPADVIAYLKSDFLDGIEQKIIRKFSDDYLIQIATVLIETDDKLMTKEEKLEAAKEYVLKIKTSKLRETKNYILREENKDIYAAVNDILDQFKDNGIDIYSPREEDSDKVNQITTSYIEKYRALCSYDESKDQNSIESEIHKIIDCTQKMLKVRQSVVDKVLTDVQDAFINDYINTTKAKWTEIEERYNKKMEGKTEEEKKKLIEERKEEKRKAMGFSERIYKAFYAMKTLDYDEYVQYTKKVYQTQSQPRAIKQLMEDCAEVIVKMGIIRDKFYDKAILASIKDDEVREAMKLPITDEKEYDKVKEKIGINELKPVKKRKKKPSKPRKHKSARKKQEARKNVLYKGLYGYIQRMDERFAIICMDTYYAIPTNIKELVKKAVDPYYEPDIYIETEQDEIYRIRDELRRSYSKDGIHITREEIDNYVEDKIKKERENFQYKVALNCIGRYIGGINDNGIRSLLEETGYVSKLVYGNEDTNDKTVNKHLQEMSKSISNALEENDEKEEDKIKPIDYEFDVDGIYDRDDMKKYTKDRQTETVSEFKKRMQYNGRGNSSAPLNLVMKDVEIQKQH